MALFLCATGFTLAGSPARAADAGAAIAFIRQVGNEIPTVLANARTVDEKRARLLPFVTRVVDVNSVARYCMGHYWNHATGPQQIELRQLFVQVVVNMIALWSGNISGAGDRTQVTMLPVNEQPEGSVVPTIVQIGAAPPIHVTWLVDMRQQPSRILDVTTEGLSARVTQKSDFISYLSHHDGDIDGLIAVLRQRAHDTGALPANEPHP